MSFGGSGGGGGRISTDSDVSLSNPATGHVLTYNNSLAVWQNQTAPVSSVDGQTGAVALSGTYATLAISTNTQTASYTLVLSDAGKVVEMNSASATTLTVPPNASVAFTVGTGIVVRQYGAGTVTIAAGAGVTIRSRGSVVSTAGQYAEASLTKRATNEWVLSGDLA